jgi:hypothetical protein
MSVDYIVNSKKPYPWWLKDHPLFKEIGKIDKVFPKIGLPNFREPCEITNTDEAIAAAICLGQRLVSYMQNAQSSLYSLLERTLSSTEPNRNERCADIQSAICLLQAVVYSMNKGDYAKVIDGKVLLRLRSDVFNGDKNSTFKKDEALLRVAGKVWDTVEKLGVNMPKIDQMNEFKSFSRVNIPNKEYMLCFSSHGEEGAWDIGTISMRGVVSCQSWNAPQSRGLIGSIASKFVGVVYLESTKEKVPEYGSKMLNRAMVRFAINKKTKTPTLIIDTVYPNHNKDTMAAFKRVLGQKSGLNVITVSDETMSGYYIPTETHNKLLKTGEASYADHPIAVQEHTSTIRKIPEDLKTITESFKKQVCDDLDKMVNLRREQYLAAEKRINELKTEYAAAKKKWEDESALIESWKPEDGDEKPAATIFELVEPRMDEELAMFGRGGVMNLLAHMDKRHGKNMGSSAFAKLFLDSIGVPDGVECESKEEYHRKYLMTYLRNPKVVKEEAHKKFGMGSWMKSFPKSGEKFFEFIGLQMKGYMVASCKEMIRKSN